MPPIRALCPGTLSPLFELGPLVFPFEPFAFFHPLRADRAQSKAEKAILSQVWGDWVTLMRSDTDMSRQSTVQHAAVPDPGTPPLPTPPTPGLAAETSDLSVPTSPVPNPTQAGRWVRIARRYPIQITFSVVVCSVLLVIVIVVLTLNMGVQQLYNQLPYNVTGVRFACFPGSFLNVQCGLDGGFPVGF